MLTVGKVHLRDHWHRFVGNSALIRREKGVKIVCLAINSGTATTFVYIGLADEVDAGSVCCNCGGECRIKNPGVCVGKGWFKEGPEFSSSVSGLYPSAQAGCQFP